MSTARIFIKNEEDPSSYYRIYQYCQGKENVYFTSFTNYKRYKWYYRKENSIVVKCIKKLFFACIGVIRMLKSILKDMKDKQPDIVIVNRTIFPRIMIPISGYILERYLKESTVYWDFDDNIIEDGEITDRESRILQRVSKEIIVTNEFLKETISPKYQNKVILLPTTDMVFSKFKLNDTNNIRIKQYQSEIVLIWVGTINNLPYLKKIIPELRKASVEICEKTHKKICLKVISNASLEADSSECITIENIPWTREVAIKELMTAHIGLMPLDDNEYTRGKGGFKAVQYIGAGIPAIVSDVGFNSQVVEDRVNGRLINDSEEWIQSIYELSTSEKLWLQYSKKAREKWEKDFNSDKNLEFWLERLRVN